MCDLRLKNCLHSGEENVSRFLAIHIRYSILVYKNKQLLNAVKVWKAKETNVILKMFSKYFMKKSRILFILKGLGS